MNEVTRILQAIEDGDGRAADELLPLVYRELRTLAERRLAHERPGQTLQATALVHEAYLRLVGSDRVTPSTPTWDSRGHFFAAAAEAMRRILIEKARAKATHRRGGRAWQRVGLDPAELSLDDVPGELLDLDEALTELAQLHPDKAQLVQLRFFAGLSLKQAAATLHLAPTTADRHWAYARAWLYDRLTASADEV